MSSKVWRNTRTNCRFILGRLGLAGVLFFGWIHSGVANNELFPEIIPSPSYTPSEVVGIQMRALGKNDKPFENAGIELTFRFASPNNQKFTGPIERFMALFSTPAYKPMLNHTKIEVGAETMIDDAAWVPVLITDNRGDQAGYMFSLSQQTSAPYENCWMTDKVIRVQIPENQSSIL